MASELIGFGLSASDKLIDKHFDKLPEKLTSPMGRDIPYITEKMHTQTGTNTVHNPHRRFPSPPPTDSDPDAPYESADARTRRSHREDRRSRREGIRDRDGYAERPERQRAADMRDEYSSPKPKHVHMASPPPQRPGFVTRRSQSMHSPRKASRRGDVSRRSRRDRSRDGSRDMRRSRSRSSSSEGIAERFMDDPVARGAMGVAVGGVLAKQAVKAGDKWKDRGKGKGKGERKGKGHADDEILVTLAGMALGGVGLLFAGDKYKEKKEREEREERHSRGKARRGGKGDEKEKERHTREWVEGRRDGEVDRYMREEKIAEEGRGGDFYDERRAYDDVWRGRGHDDRRQER